MATPKLFMLGVGYIGGSVLHLLLPAKRYEIITISRRAAQIAELEKLGVRAIKGSLEDANLVSSIAYDSDVIICTSGADLLEPVEAYLQGVEKRSNEGKKTIVIHTSGSGVLDDNANNAYPAKKVYDDATPDDVQTLDNGKPHRFVDLKVLESLARCRGLATIRIVMPTLIYGDNIGSEKRTSVQIPRLIAASLKYGFAGVVGNAKGASQWGHVHVQDVAEGYVLLLKALEEGKSQAKSQNDVYVFVEDGEHTWYELSAGIGKRLHERGLIKSPDVRAFNAEQIKGEGLIVPKEGAGGFMEHQYLSCNSMCKASKLRAIGWKPSHSGLYQCLDYDIDQVLANQKK